MTETVSVNGVKLGYEVSGQGEPLLFIHGFLASGTGAYYDRFKHLLAAEYTVHAIDMRSHGRSNGIDDGLDFAQLAKDIVASAEALELEDALLVGHSMGGYLGRAAALLDASRFHALVTITPAASKGAPTEAMLPDLMAARADRDLMHQRFGDMFQQPPGEARLDVLRDAALRLPDPVFEHWVRDEWPATDQAGMLPAIDLPVLVLLGTKDVVVPPPTQFQDASLLRHGRIVALTDQGHMLPVEEPALCLREIRRFVTDLR